MSDMPNREQPMWTLHAPTPPLQDYLHLQTMTSLSPKSTEAALKGLQNTHFALTAHCTVTRRVIGMSCIIGDGGIFFQFVDIAIELEWQGDGIGRLFRTIMQ
jgi:hypothetical protein